MPALQHVKLEASSPARFCLKPTYSRRKIITDTAVYTSQATIYVRQAVTGPRSPGIFGSLKGRHYVGPHNLENRELSRPASACGTPRAWSFPWI